MPLLRWRAVHGCRARRAVTTPCSATGPRPRCLELRHRRSGPIDVTVPARRRSPAKGIAVHVTRSLPESRSRCARASRARPDAHPGRPGRGASTRATAGTRVSNGRSSSTSSIASPSKPCSSVQRSPRHRDCCGGSSPDLPDEPPPTASELERRLLELIRAAGLPYPVVNGHIGELRSTSTGRTHKLVVETDGRGDARARDRLPPRPRPRPLPQPSGLARDPPHLAAGRERADAVAVPRLASCPVARPTFRRARLRRRAPGRRRACATGRPSRPRSRASA